MNKKSKTLAGFLTVAFCILAGCGRKEAGSESFLLYSQEGAEESFSGQGEAFSDVRGSDGSSQELKESVSGGGGSSAGESVPGQNTQGQGVSVEGASSGSDSGAVSTAKAGQGSRDFTEKSVCVVHICGAVERPGVYTLEEGSRIYQAIDQAGGFREDARQDYLNQADLLLDGMKVYVPTDEEIEQAQGDFVWKSSGVEENKKTDAKEEPSSLININTAGEEQLCTLPGVGSSKAKSIIAWREKNGAYRSIEEIMNVEGIKEGVFEKIKDSITV